MLSALPRPEKKATKTHSPYNKNEKRRPRGPLTRHHIFDIHWLVIGSWFCAARYLTVAFFHAGEKVDGILSDT